MEARAGGLEEEGWSRCWRPRGLAEESVSEVGGEKGLMGRGPAGRRPVGRGVTRVGGAAGAGSGGFWVKDVFVHLALERT